MTTNSIHIYLKYFSILFLTKQYIYEPESEEFDMYSYTFEFFETRGTSIIECVMYIYSIS